jgi:hypothetical protein
MVDVQIAGTSSAGGDNPRWLRIGPFLSEEQLWLRIEEELDHLCAWAEASDQTAANGAFGCAWAAAQHAPATRQHKVSEFRRQRETM